MIISPHIDDEILGCFSVLSKETFVLECGVDKFHIVSKAERINELTQASQKVGFDFSILSNPVNRYVVQDLIDDLAENIYAIKPDRIFIPYPSYNQDHRTVYEAVLIALRQHDVNYFVKKVCIYEEPDMFLWDYTHDIDGAFKPNYFIPVDIDTKIEMYKFLKSQVRSFRSPELLKNLAFCRGKQGNMNYAESFKIIRWVE